MTHTGSASAPTDRDCERFARWLLERVIRAGRGDDVRTFEHRPQGRFWIGRLAPQAASVVETARDEDDRLDPCAIGIRVRPTALDGRQVVCRVRACGWVASNGGHEKRGPVCAEIRFQIPTSADSSPIRVGGDEIAEAFRRGGLEGLRAEVHCELERVGNDPHLVITLVNVSPKDLYERNRVEPYLFEVELECEVGPTEDFVTERTPDAFRFVRQVPAYGVNCGVERLGPGRFRTVDYLTWRQPRPEFWDQRRAGTKPDLRFATLANDPVPPLQHLKDALRAWTQREWSDSALEDRARQQAWTQEMLDRARQEAERARKEVEEIERGLDLLEANDTILRAFRLTNQAFARARQLGTLEHDEWRPFQVGFLLFNLPLFMDERDRRTVSTLWFPTGSGKTEAYIGLLLLAAFWDRLRGKKFGVTGWARFPLRALSFQQMQRMADLLAAAELVRSCERLGGDEFRLGFFVGESSTPNRIRRRESGDPDVPPGDYRCLLHCPFCRWPDVRVEFERRSWRLIHLCGNQACPWKGRPLPICVVDEEVYRLLPTVVVGTVDKAALAGLQAAMRGLYGAPLGLCPGDGHGFTYAPRESRPNGCLYPGCTLSPKPLPQDEALFPPTVRIQDEIHLLRDSLGAVDSHYERLLDHLQQASVGFVPTIVGSSATIAGHDRQVQSLYGRPGRVFPIAGPDPGKSFWAVFDYQQPEMRTYVALAPRGVTLEFASDRCVEALQRAVREALRDPDRVAQEAGVDRSAIPELASLYGTTVIYGCTVKDVEAATRSARTQIRLDPGPSGRPAALEVVTLTGRTPAEEVREVLRRLQHPEPDHEDRIHVVAASSMLSHGVDLDRLNVMVMWGLPLTVAELVQSTSRIGRRYAGLVLVVHKMGRERDARVFTTFPVFLANAHQLVDPVPITHRSRRVLELTFPGLFMGRLLGIHEPAALRRGRRGLSSVRRARSYVLQVGKEEFVAGEHRGILQTLGVGGSHLDSPMVEDARAYVEEAVRRIVDPATRADSVFDALPRRPMTSLRDVEDSVRVYCEEE